MPDISSLLERADRAVSEVPLPDDGLERIFRRRDRTHRRQRIAAGAVGIAVFGMAAWIVATRFSIDATHDRKQQPAWSEDAPIWGGQGPEYYLPPKDALPSTPEEGDLVESLIHPFGRYGPSRFIYVYADGRVLSWVGPDGGGVPDTINERRLNREGLNRVRSGNLPLVELFGRPQDEVPGELWKEATMRPYVPSRYELCYVRDGGRDLGDIPWGLDTSPFDPSDAVRSLPAQARSVLAAGTTPTRPGCVGITTDQAWALVDVLGSISSYALDEPQTISIQDADGTKIDWDIAMILPDGARPPVSYLRGWPGTTNMHV